VKIKLERLLEIQRQLDEEQEANKREAEICLENNKLDGMRSSKRDALNKYLNDLTAQKNQAAKAEKQKYIDLIVQGEKN
jgi:hypothetical protein